MKSFIKEKITGIILTTIVALLFTVIGFYYRTNYDINYLKESTDKTSIRVETLETRMNEKDVQYREIIVRQDYTIQMLEEIKKELKEAR